MGGDQDGHSNLIVQSIGSDRTRISGLPRITDGHFLGRLDCFRWIQGAMIAHTSCTDALKQIVGSCGSRPND